MKVIPVIRRVVGMRRHRGFALAFSLVFFAIATFLLLGLFSMISSSARAAEIYIGRNQCRLAAQSMIEIVKPQIDVAFSKHTGGTTVRIGPKSSTAYTWFNAYSDYSLGDDKYKYELPTTNLVVNGCRLKLRFGKCGQIENSPSAIVSLIVRAQRQNANGTVSDIAVEERFRFGISRSKVFDYAYFVNNYGWFDGSSITANGDVRANGDMSLKQSPKVNGEVWAAHNEELGVNGDINAYGAMDSRSEYKNNTKVNGQSRPLSPPYDNGPEWIGGYNAPSQKANTNDLKNRTHANEEVGISMPWIGNLSEYVEYAVEQGGTLSGGVRYRQNVNGDLISETMPTISAHYSKEEQAGPSGDITLADKGALVIVGTESNPIKINGPVVVDSDVVIKGYVTGQGTIYSGRNIHILGDITYKNPPNWPHMDNNPEQTAKNNSTKDLVAFAAKGNIVLGYDSNYYDIRETLGSTPYVQEYTCDESDKDIGYPRTTQYGFTRNEEKFCGDYRAEDGGKMVKIQEVGTGQYTGYGQNRKEIKEKKFVDSQGRHYYNSVVEDSLLEKLNQVTTTSTDWWGNKTTSTSKYRPKHIDGVLYNNHGVFGFIGECVINGALICRNEGIRFETSFTINWDIRLREDSREGISNSLLGAPIGASPPGVVSFHEIPLEVANLEM